VPISSGSVIGVRTFVGENDLLDERVSDDVVLREFAEGDPRDAS
jgi:hypothetical protein